MTPGLLLLTCVLLTALAAAADVAAHRRRSRALRALASQWRMNYHPADQLRLTPKVLPRFPVPGAANVHVMDLIYGSDRDRYRYVFSVEFTLGVVGPKRRVVRVASLSEPRERGATGPVSLTLAPAKGTLLDQYRALAPATSSSAAIT
jgi:hypothetical protein